MEGRKIIRSFKKGKNKNQQTTYETLKTSKTSSKSKKDTWGGRIVVGYGARSARIIKERSKAIAHVELSVTLQSYEIFRKTYNRMWQPHAFRVITIWNFEAETS